MELMMTGDMIGADEAKNLGLVNHIFPAAELIAGTTKILSKINGKAPVAIKQVIACVNEAARGDEAGFRNEIARFGECFSTADMREGTQAFLEKRKAVFIGK
jgi:enoyl-CoA hydratase